MNLLSQIFIAILVTSFTGTIALGLWKATRRFVFYRNPDLIYPGLKLACLLYLLPVGYISMQLTLREGYVQTDEPWQLNFGFAGILWILGIVVGVSWLGATLRCVIACIRGFQKENELHCFCVPEEDEEVIREFLRVKKKLKIRRNLRLYRNEKIASPMIFGVFSYRVLLPCREYTTEQLSVIFHHELIHYKSRDSFFKLCGRCIISTQHLNPIASELLDWLNEWSEFQCDARAIAAISDELDAGRYFENILESMGRPITHTYEGHIFSGLCESQVKLERRIDYMKKYAKIKRTAKGMTALCAFTFAMMSVTTTYAAGAKVADVHDVLYQNVEVTEADANAEQELQEIYLPASQDNSYEDLVYANPELELIAPILEANESVPFQWTVTPGTRHVSGTFYVKAGQTISVSASATPGGNTFWIGIQDGWNNVRYVEGTDSLGHSFSITSSGKYRVLVQNRGNSTITATGAYYYY